MFWLYTETSDLIHQTWGPAKFAIRLNASPVGINGYLQLDTTNFKDYGTCHVIRKGKGGQTTARQFSSAAREHLNVSNKKHGILKKN
jgi:hypothetical protein